MAEGAPEDGAPMMPEEEAVSAAEAGQMQQAIDQLLSKIQQLEEQGRVPQGFTQKAAQLVENEINAGGTGEQAMTQIMEQLQQYAQGAGGQGAPAAQPPGVAPTA